MTNQTMIYIHIPKTAGNTLHRILHREYMLKRGNVFQFANPLKIKKFIALPEGFRKKLSLIKGHLHYGVHNYINMPAQYFVMLREPIKRTLSHYNYLRVSRDTMLYKEMKQNKYTLDELFESGRVLNLDNCQVRFLCGVDNIPFDGVTEQHLESAINNLTLINNQDGIGIAEYFDESILLFSQKFNWRMPWYLRRNVNNNPLLKLTDLNSQTMEKLKHFNRYDEILYRKAHELFKLKLDSANPSFAKEVAAFKKENEGRQMRTAISDMLSIFIYKLRFYLGTQKH